MRYYASLEPRMAVRRLFERFTFAAQRILEGEMGEEILGFLEFLDLPGSSLCQSMFNTNLQMIGNFFAEEDTEIKLSGNMLDALTVYKDGATDILRDFDASGEEKIDQQSYDKVREYVYGALYALLQMLNPMRVVPAQSTVAFPNPQLFEYDMGAMQHSDCSVPCMKEFSPFKGEDIERIVFSIGYSTVTVMSGVISHYLHGDGGPSCQVDLRTAFSHWVHLGINLLYTILVDSQAEEDGIPVEDMENLETKEEEEAEAEDQEETSYDY